MIRRGGARRERGNYGTKGTSAARGFGLARSTRYPFPACVSPESSLPVLASIRTSPFPLAPQRSEARARALAHPPVVSPSLFPPTRRRRRRPHRLAGDDRDREAASLM